MKLIILSSVVFFTLNTFSNEECRPENYSVYEENSSKLVRGSEITNKPAVEHYKKLMKVGKSSELTDRFGRVHMKSVSKLYNKKYIYTNLGLDEVYQETTLLDYCSYNTQSMNKSMKCATYCNYRASWREER